MFKVNFNAFLSSKEINGVIKISYLYDNAMNIENRRNMYVNGLACANMV